MTPAERHCVISYWKSGIRIVGFFLLPFDIFIAAWALMGAEVLGIAEEMFGS